VRKHKNFCAVAAIAISASLVPALSAQTVQSLSQSDLDAIYKIKEEGFKNSKVMETMSYLTDLYGPRLTGSPNAREAAEWAMGRLKEGGATNVHLESWGPFGRGWANEKFSAQVISPRSFPLIAYPEPWTPGTNGTVTGSAVIAPIKTEADFEKYRGQLRGKFVLTEPEPQVSARFQAQTRRYTETELADLATQQVPAAQQQDTPEQRLARYRATRAFEMKVDKFYLDEGVAGLLDPSFAGDDGTVYEGPGGSRKPDAPPSPVRMVLALENYGRIYRMVDKKASVQLEVNIQNKFYDNDLNSFDIIGELPGADRSKADQIVMVGAHFDSWQVGTGATDNGAGSGVMIEVMRILKASGVKLPRTVRIGLWTGEEQGLLGSRAYMKQHFGDQETMQLLPEHAKLDAYYNIDNGTGKIRGVYLQENEAEAPIFEKWMEPFRNLGMNTLTIRNTGGTDHLAFNALGLPGFQFIQDPMDYETRTHHSNMDVYERIQEPDMKQMAVIVASFVYLTANRPEMMPRKPLPKPQPIIHYD
jgi:hypothetical protein